jgi:hypothetical protein
MDRVQRGDVFQGVLADPLVANGFVVGERGAPVTGRDYAEAAELSERGWAENRGFDRAVVGQERAGIDRDSLPAGGADYRYRAAAIEWV